MSNTALVLGVGRFTAEVGSDEEPEIGSAAWHPLAFVYALIPQLADSLKGLGYLTTQVVDPNESALRSALEQSVGSDGEHCRVLHLISHGFTDPDGDPTRVDVVPTSGRVGIGTNISEWVSSAQTLRRPTLFLLDLCRSGRAARLPFLLAHAGRHTHVWVIAASGTDEDAYDGRFSRAVVDTLHELSRTGLGADPTRRHVAFSAVARHVRRRVESAPGLPQTVLATAMDLGLDEPDLPFFPNPRFREGTARRTRLGVSPPLRAFLDDLTEIDGSDAGHFTDRAGQHFVGRRAQLRLLAPWLDDDAVGGLRVVTGSPGAGKSALLGALVCAAHTELVAVVPHVRARLQAQDPLGCPSQHAQLAAVHARQRTLDEVIAAIVRQLKLPTPADAWQPATLVQALGRLTAPPPVVVDALDEAIDPLSICDELLVPLARAARPDGKPVCRLLVGMRPWEEFIRLRQAALAQDGLIDLDAVGTPELRTDLAGYLAGTLADMPGYAPREQRAVRERLASATAAELTSPTARTDEWGAFLVGSVLTGYLLNREPARTPQEAERIAQDAPTTLPGVLELDLSLRPDPVALRGVLSAVALAKGDGMPAEVIARLAAGPTPDGAGPTPVGAGPTSVGADPAAVGAGPDPGDDTVVVQRLLDEARFYLRTGVEPDGTTLYRLFHQGLTDHLRRQPSPEPGTAPPDPGEILDRLLAGITGPQAAGWGTAPPYLLRHAIEHAVEAGREEELITDPEFLVHADPDTLVPVLDHVRGDEARSAAAVYRASIDLHRTLLPESRRRLLAIDAARYQDRSLLSRLSLPSSEGWMPRWATGFGVTRALRRTLAHPQGVERLTCTTLSGGPVAVTGGYDGVVRVWNLESGRLYGEPMTGHVGPVHGVVCTTVGGQQVVVSAGADGTVRSWYLETGGFRHEVTVGGSPKALVGTMVRGRPAVVVVGDTITALDVDSGAVLYEVPNRPGADQAHAAVLRGRHVVVIGGWDGHLRVWDADTGTPVRDLYVQSEIWAFACASVQKRAVVLTSHRDGAVHTWDLARGRRLFRPLHPGPGRIDGLACITVEGAPIVLTSGWAGTVQVTDLVLRRAHPPLVGHSHTAHVITSTTIDGSAKAVTGSREGTARVWDLPVGPPARKSRGDRSGTASADAVYAVACTTVDGRGVAVTAGDSGVRIRDLATGQPVGAPLGDGTRTLTPVTMGGRAFAVTTGGLTDRSVHVWDLSTRERLLDPWEGGSVVTCMTLRGRPVTVEVDWNGRFQVRDILTGQSRELTSGRPEGVFSMACTTLNGRPIVVTGTGSGVLRWWDLETGQPVSDQIQAHDGELCTVSCALADGRPVALTGYFGGARSGRMPVPAEPCLWDLSQRRPTGTPLKGHTGWVVATALTVRHGRPIAVTGDQDATVRLWRADGTCLRTLEMPAPVSDLSVADSGELAVVVDPGDLVIIEPDWTEA
ncbi:hypothetical protein [Streptomyces sp. NPDC001530]|uniref:hypothetical protein n=1 Tax=Streptomyces sp. NPDC001530 TaxID=3364582 RepID=UPI0036BCA8CB